jgi:hypothetical protein
MVQGLVTLMACYSFSLTVMLLILLIILLGVLAYLRIKRRKRACEELSIGVDYMVLWL